MPEFIAEQYFSRTDAAGARRAAITARRAAEQLAREGGDVELVRSSFVPEDETCIFVYAADSLDTVVTAAEYGGLALECIAQAAVGVEGRSATGTEDREVPLL